MIVHVVDQRAEKVGKERVLGGYTCIKPNERLYKAMTVRLRQAKQGDQHAFLLVGIIHSPLYDTV